MPPFALNAFRLNPEPATCDAFTRPARSTSEVRPLRKSLGESWFFYYDHGTIFGLPRGAEPAQPFGERGTLDLSEHLWILRALVEDALPSAFKARKPLRLHPLTLGAEREEDLVQRAAYDLKLDHPLLAQFSVRSKLEIEPRVVGLGDRDRQLALFFSLGSRWEISAALPDLMAAGLDLSGLVATRREHRPGERDVLGRIVKIEGGQVHIAEGYEATTPVPVGEARLEGRKDVFERCLGSLLGPAAWRQLERAVQDRVDADLTGPKQRERLKPIVDFLRKRPIALAGGASVRVGDEITVPAEPGFAVTTPRVAYCFDASKQKRDDDNWRGLRRFGPMSRETLRQHAPHIAVFCDEDHKDRVGQLVRKLRDGVPTPEGVFDAGFGRIFHLSDVRFELHPLRLGGVGSAKVAERFRTEALKAIEPDALPAAALVFIDDRVADLPEHINPYWNVRAGLMMMGVPVQALRLSLLGRHDGSLQYVLQNIAIALYAKIEGTPWTIAHDETLRDELVIGLGVAEIQPRFSPRQRVVGVTTVFGGDGRYRVGTLSQESTYEDYPEVLRATTLDVLGRARDKYGWQPGDRVRVVFHAWKPLRKVEVAKIVGEATRTVGKDLKLEFAVLTVSHEHPARLFDLQQRGMRVKNQLKGELTPERGVIVRLSDDEHLVCTQGPAQLKRPGQPLPDPLLVRLHRDHGLERTDLWYLSEQVLKFTSLSWKSRFPSALPATIYYSKLIAEQLGRLQRVPGWSSMTLNQKLSESKWFL